MGARKQLRWWLFLALVAVSGCDRNEKPAALGAGAEAPELEGALTWINSSALRLADLRGKVVLISFFDYSCVNCIRALPYLKQWQCRYAPMGLVIIGVHSPQYEFSMDPANVYAGVRHLDVTFPVAVDSHYRIADAYQNRFWPRMFLVDKDGHIRFEHTGEGGYQDAEAVIQKLLHEVNPTFQMPPVLPPVRGVDRPGAVCQPITPELYLGKTRGQLGNAEANATNTVVKFQLPEQRQEGRVYAEGEWSNQSEYLRHAVDKDALVDFVALKYRAVELNVVMKPEDIYWIQVYVQQDGQWLSKDIAGVDVKYDAEGRSCVPVDAARMYNLIAQQPYGTYEVRLFVNGRGLSIYSFSFGTCEIIQGADKLGTSKEPL